MSSDQNLVKLLSAEEFSRRLTCVVDDMSALARDLVTAIDARPVIVDELIALGIQRDIISRFELFGRGLIHPKLFANESQVAKRLRRLPLSTQNRALEDGLEVLDDNETTMRLLPIEDLTPAQVKQVFAPDHVRSIAEQRTIIRTKKSKLGVAVPDKDYRVYKDRVDTFKPGVWSKQTILQWLQMMG